jgi:hypothetical protein
MASVWNWLKVASSVRFWLYVNIFGPTARPSVGVMFGSSQYCGISAENQNFEASRGSRCYGTALQTRPLLGNGSVAVM